MATVASTGGKASPVRRFVTRFVLLSLLWWVLNPRDGKSWIVGLPVVVLATWAGSKLSPNRPFNLRLRGLLRFIPFFLVQSWRGGLDVALRALRPQMPIDPALLRYDVRLPEGTARSFFVSLVSLLPGTLSADMDASTLVVHALSASGDIPRELAVQEETVAALFGIELVPGRSASA